MFSDQLTGCPQLPSPKKDKMSSLAILMFANVLSIVEQNKINEQLTSTFVKHMEVAFYRVSNEVSIIVICTDFEWCQAAIQWC